MQSTSNSDAPKGPPQPSQLPKTEIPSSSVFGFPVSSNQFQILQDSRSTESTSSRQVQDRLIDPRTTRLARLQATRRDAGQGTVTNEGNFEIVPPVKDAQGTFDSGECVSPIASEIRH